MHFTCDVELPLVRLFHFKKSALSDNGVRGEHRYHLVPLFPFEVGHEKNLIIISTCISTDAVFVLRPRDDEFEIGINCSSLFKGCIGVGQKINFQNKSHLIVREPIVVMKIFGTHFEPFRFRWTMRKLYRANSWRQFEPLLISRLTINSICLEYFTNVIEIFCNNYRCFIKGV